MTPGHYTNKMKLCRRALLPAETVKNILLDRVKIGEPFSYLRLGDGEGLLLSTEAHSITQEDYNYFETHFGSGCRIADIIEIKNLLEIAALDADLLGIRDDVWLADPGVDQLCQDEPNFYQRYKMSLPLRSCENNIADHPLRRLFGLQKWIAANEPFEKLVTSQWVHYDLALMGFWRDILSLKAEFSLITASRTLAENVRKVVPANIEVYCVPEKSVDRHRHPLDFRKYYPDSYNEVADLLLSRSQKGKLFLVGAGLVGKSFCSIVKRNGGIALDLGALLDAWDGRPTRPLVYASKAPGSTMDHTPFAL